MEKNIGKTEQIIRLIITILLFMILYSEIFTGGVAVLILLIATVFLTTAITAYCPIYKWLNTDTNQAK